MRREIPVIVNKGFASYSWGIKCVASLKKSFAKNGYTIRLIMNENEISKLKGFSHVLVMGVNRAWIRSTLEILSANNIVGILLYSDIGEQIPNSFLINTDQTSSVKLSIEHMLANGRENIALFGIHEGDISDASKAKSFLDIAKNRDLLTQKEDVYTYSDDIMQCFRAFYNNAQKYDAVICANDLIGVFLVNECKRMGVRIPEDMFVVGNGNTWIGSHISPTLTTIDGKTDAKNVLNDYIVKQYEIICNYSHIESMQILLSSRLIERESTGFSFKPESIDGAGLNLGRNDMHEDHIIDPIIKEISLIDRELTFCKKIDLKIIAAQCNNYSYQRTAEELFLSVDALKYHVKRIYKSLNVNNRTELSMLLNKYGVILG